MGEDIFTKTYRAFGLNYIAAPAPYNIERLQQLNNSANIARDQQQTLGALTKWREKFQEKQKPKMIFLCVSGGGKRAALWTLGTLQVADSVTQGKLFKNTMLITGASVHRPISADGLIATALTRPYRR